MPYDAEISRPNPLCLVILLDQSGSMSDGWAGEPGRLKADAVATIINRLLSDLVISCTVEEDVYDRFSVSIIGYGGTAGPALGGALSGKELVSLAELAMHPLRIEDRMQQVEDGTGGLVEQTVKFPVWFDPVAAGGTPMCAALNQAKRIVGQWVSDRPATFPPEVLNITDGEATDGNPLDVAEEIRSMSTQDGNVLLFNAHVSSLRGPGRIEFPANEDLLADGFSRLLFRMSSTLPEPMVQYAQKTGFVLEPGARGFVFNATAVDLIRFLDIGTRSLLDR